MPVGADELREELGQELRWVYGLSAQGVKLGLERMEAAVARRGHPERGLRVVHVAGSNGKGSVCAMVERALRAAGLRTGWFSSPHLHRYAERFRIDGVPLEDAEIAGRLKAQREADLDLTFFEHAALLAFEAFRDHGCDVVVLEVGLGGRLDATNIALDPEVAVITRIALEHTNILGDTHALIAAEKGGILKAGASAVLGVRHPDASDVLVGMCEALGVVPSRLGVDFDGEPIPGGARVRVDGEAHDYALGLAGAFQAENAAIAVAALRALRERGFAISDDAIVEGLGAARWAGRLERLEHGDREVLVDCAHNPDGCEALGAHLRTLEPRRTVLLFGAMEEKDHENMLAPLDDVIDARVYAIPVMRRAPDPSVFAQVRPGEVAPDIASGLERALSLAGEGGRVVIAGSIFLVNEARAELLGLERDPPIAL